jgi:hypothetical protein
VLPSEQRLRAVGPELPAGVSKHKGKRFLVRDSSIGIPVVIFVPILGIAVGVVAVVLGCVLLVRLAKHRESAALVRFATFFGAAAVGLLFWTLQLKK